MAGPTLVGARGSVKRRLVLVGIAALGAAVLLLAGGMAEASVKQVYWAVYSRLHPMRDATESYGFSQGTGQAGAAGDPDALAATVAQAASSDDAKSKLESLASKTSAGDALGKGGKPAVALLPAGTEQIKDENREQTAAREAHQREADQQDQKEEKRIQSVAEQQLAKATRAYSTEIEAIAGREEADRLTDKLQQEPSTVRTVLEQEAAATTGRWQAAQEAAHQRLADLHRLLFPATAKALGGGDSKKRAAAKKQRPGGRALLGAAAEEAGQGRAGAVRAAMGAADEAVEGRKGRMRAAKGREGEDGGEAQPQPQQQQHHPRHKHTLITQLANARHHTADASHDNASHDSASHDSAQSGHEAWDPFKRVRSWDGQPEEFALTQERAEGLAEGGVLLVTWANHEYLDFAVNWVAHMWRLNISAFMIGAMDARLLKDLVELGVERHVFSMDSKLDSGDLSWGSPHFFQMGREKIQLVEKFAAMGLDTLISDIDTVWLKDPLPYIARFPEADVLCSSDAIANTTETDLPERLDGAGAAFNIGIILMRRTTLDFVKEWNAVLANDSLYWDQNAFNDLLRRNFSYNPEQPQHLFLAYGGKLKAGILPVALFANGHTFHVQDLAARMHLEPYVVHNTFQFSGTGGKRHRFRERLMWLADRPSYYEPEGGLLSFDFRVDHLLPAVAAMNLSGQLADLWPHFDLANAQLTQVRNALVLATALNRTLVLPKFISGLDRWWAPHPGLIPGSNGMAPPMFMPADHILDLGAMAEVGDAEELGPPFRFREHSFFENPRTPRATLESRLLVRVCKPFERGCTAGPERLVSDAFGLRLHWGLKDKQLAAIFEAFKDTRVLHFDDLSSGIAGFESDEDLIRFHRRTKVAASIWCCVDKHPGHVWYDMWWDHPGHVDRHGRKFDRWEPLTGP